MIRISTFDLINNFTRQDYKFTDDALVIKIKSLTHESEYETRYDKIKVISWKTLAETRWLWIAFILISLTGIVNSFFDFPFQDNVTVQSIEKVVIILGFILYIPVFRKQQYCSFYDADRNHLATIKVDKSNQGFVENAISLIRKKTKIICEENPKSSLTDIPVFELRQFEFPNFLNRSTIKFYEDRLLELEKSLIQEMATEVKYSELSGKTQVIKNGNENWNHVWEKWLFFWTTVSMFFLVFFPKLITAHSPYPYILLSGWALLLPPIILRYVKEEVLMLYNKNDEPIYVIKQNAANKEKLVQIVEFIQSKISA